MISMSVERWNELRSRLDRAETVCRRASILASRFEYGKAEPIDALPQLQEALANWAKYVEAADKTVDDYPEFTKETDR